MREDHDRVKAVCDWGIQAAVCGYLRQWHSKELREISPDSRWGIIRWVAGFGKRSGIPETHEELAFRTTSKEWVLTREVNEIKDARANRIGAGRTGHGHLFDAGESDLRPFPFPTAACSSGP